MLCQVLLKLCNFFSSIFLVTLIIRRIFSLEIWSQREIPSMWHSLALESCLLIMSSDHVIVSRAWVNTGRISGLFNVHFSKEIFRFSTKLVIIWVFCRFVFDTTWLSISLFIFIPLPFEFAVSHAYSKCGVNNFGEM